MTASLLLIQAILALIWSVQAAPSPSLYDRGNSNKIVGGQEAAPGQLPYQVSFQQKLLGSWYHFCGGVIISPRYVLTAAHCVEGGDFTSPNDLRVVAGEMDLDALEATEQIGVINFMIQHPFYNPITLENDVALLRLEVPLLYAEGVDQIDLPQSGQNFTGEVCRVSGWGVTTEGGDLSNMLLYTDIPVLSDDTCNESYTYDEIFPSMLCAGGETAAGHGSCQGDSGGPLVCGSTLAGLVSWAYGCARPEYPTVFTEVSSFVDWINSHTRF